MTYPKLMSTTRLMKRAEMCWIIDKAHGIDEYLNWKEALFLAFCNGRFSVDDIIMLYKTVVGDDNSNNYFERFNAILQSNKECSDEQARYDPAEFIYNQQAGPLTEQQRLETPVEALLSLTGACNFRCIYCFNTSEKKQKDELSTGEWLNVIRQLAEMDVGVVTLTGGEPMLHEGFFDILEELVRCNIFPFICTNGSKIDQFAVGVFKNLGIDLIQVSFDAPEKEFDMLTGIEGSYQRVCKAIKELVEAGICVHVKSVVTAKNIDSILELYDLLSDLGVSRLTLDRYDTGPICRAGMELMVTDKQMIELKNSFVTKSGKMRVAVADGRKRWLSKEDIVPCGAFRRSMLIMPNGEFNGCEKMIGIPDLEIGNIRDKSLKELWYSDKIKKILMPNINDISTDCASCENLEKCNTGCFAVKHSLNYSMYDVDPRCFKAKVYNNPYAVL